jgi:hypothetical protein
MGKDWVVTGRIGKPLDGVSLELRVSGAIEEKWNALGGAQGFLGRAVSGEEETFDGVGRFQNFNGGIISWHPETGAHAVGGGIGVRWLQMGREAFGYPITDESTTSDGRGRFNHFRAVQLPDKPEASIYWTPETGAHPVFGGIRQRWAEIGYEQSFLGYPTAGEGDFDEGGRVGAFEHGAIYWWPDTGAIELGDVAVRYTGLYCFGETDSDQLSPADEPYVTLGVVGPNGGSAFRSQVYTGVDSGDSRPDLQDLYRGNPGGLTLATVLMEQDFEDPDKYKEAMKGAVTAGFAGATALIALIPAVGPILSGGAALLFKAIAPDVTDFFNRALDTADDRLDDATIALSAKQMVVLAARTPHTNRYDIGYKVETPLLSGEGGSYRAYFDVVPV